MDSITTVLQRLWLSITHPTKEREFEGVFSYFRQVLALRLYQHAEHPGSEVLQGAVDKDAVEENVLDRGCEEHRVRRAEDERDSPDDGGQHDCHIFLCGQYHALERAVATL